MHSVPNRIHNFDHLFWYVFVSKQHFLLQRIEINYLINHGEISPKYEWKLWQKSAQKTMAGRIKLKIIMTAN